MKRSYGKIKSRQSVVLASAAIVFVALAAPATSSAGQCDDFDRSVCLQPWPNNQFAKKDKSTPTGLRLNLLRSSMPANTKGVKIDPTDINRADGFSPGSYVSVRVPGLDTPAAFTASKLVPLTDMGQFGARGASAVIIDAATGQRQLIWAELDAQAGSAANTNLLIRPGKNFLEGHRYIVALRSLKSASGATLAAPAAFRSFRDKKSGGGARRAVMEDIFKRLAKAKIARKDLYLAWDFTVASEKSLSGRMLKIRNDAFTKLGDKNLADNKIAGSSPKWKVTEVVDYSEAQDANRMRRVSGTFTVPCYLNAPGCPAGSHFKLGKDGLPVQTPGNTLEARFLCNIPRSARVNGVVQAMEPTMYGHGLLGDYGEANSLNVRQFGFENRMIVCATDWSGMAEDDIGNAVKILQDLSYMNELADRDQQGFLNFMYLGRLLAHSQGLTTAEEFKLDGVSTLKPGYVAYYGNSQGGIMGGALTALSPDVVRSVLYVPGMNYSTLLTRSVDFDEFAQFLYLSYPDTKIHPLIFSIMQLLWDRGEPNGYAQHMTTKPLPNTPAHKVMIAMSYGDHQVSNTATEVEARTIGASIYRPIVGGAGRSPDVTPGYAIPTLGSLPRDGNAMFVWDIGPLRTIGGAEFGTPFSPVTNTPPRIGVDPHDLVIESSAAIRGQIGSYIKRGGQITGVCGGEPCRAAGWTGAP